MKKNVFILLFILPVILSGCASPPDEPQSFIIAIHAPEGYHINEEAPSDVSALHQGEKLESLETMLTGETLTASFRYPEGDSELSLEIKGTFYICTDSDLGTCYIIPYSFQRNLKRSDDETVIDFTVSPPKLE